MLEWMNEWDKLNIEKNINSFILNQKHWVAQVIIKQSNNVAIVHFELV